MKALSKSLVERLRMSGRLGGLNRAVPRRTQRYIQQLQREVRILACD
jgi:hypothetical protein